MGGSEFKILAYLMLKFSSFPSHLLFKIFILLNN